MQQNGETDTGRGAAENIVLVIGGLLVALGVVYQAATSSGTRQPSTFDQILSAILLAVGGGVLGAGINTVIVRKYESDALAEVKSVLASSLQARFSSPNDDLAMYRRDWHHYYVTQMGDKFCWWYQVYSFGRNSGVGSITQSSTVVDSDGVGHAYLTELGVRGGRLVVIETRQDHTEASSIDLYPMPRGFRSVHAGVMCLENWNGSQLLAKAILSRDELIAGVTEGRIASEHTAALDHVWKENFSHSGRLVFDDLDP